MKQKGNLVVYVPNYRQKIGFMGTWIIMLRNIYNSREMIFQLFKRDFLNTYKKSFLGMSWIVISPIIGIISWVFMNQAGILNPGNAGIPYPAFVLLSSSIWGLFMGFYSSAAGTLGAGSGFIMQVKFPHEALLVKQAAQHVANFSITFVINIIVLLLFQVVPDWRIIFFPIVTLPLFFLGSAIGLFASVVSVVAADLTSILNICLGFVFYITPVIYVMNSVTSEVLLTIIRINPLTYLVGGTRDLIIYGEITNPERFIFISFICFFAFLLSWRLFFVSEYKVIEKMI